MNGVITFFTILAALMMGYLRGINTKRKKINSENKELKKQISVLKNEIKKMKSIRYDFQVNTGAFKKKDIEGFMNDAELTINLDSIVRKYYLSLAALLKSSDLKSSDNLFNIEKLSKELESIEEHEDVVEMDIGEEHMIVEVYDIRNDLNELFRNIINHNEYEITYNGLYFALVSVLEKTKESSKIKKIRHAFAWDK